MRETKGKSPHFRTTALIFSTFILGLSSVIGHYTFFTYLNGKLVDDGPIRQSYATNISLLFVTIFRLSMVGCVSLCFAQRLWQVLRENVLPIFRVNQLFIIRTQPLVLVNVRLLWAAPLLFSMAVYIWFIELAAVYPPGALRVTSQPYENFTELEIPVINAPLTRLYNVPTEESRVVYKAYPLLCSIGYYNHTKFGGQGYGFEYMYGRGFGISAVYTLICQSLPLCSLSALSRSILMSGRIADLTSPAGPNASYSLHFRAPQLSCADTITNKTVTESYPYTSTAFISAWTERPSKGLREELVGFYNLSQTRYFGWFVDEGLHPLLKDLTTMPEGGEFAEFEETEIEVHFATEERRLECDLNSEYFNVEISFVDGFQHISYTSNDPQPLGLLYSGIFDAGRNDSYRFQLPLQPGPSAIFDNGSVIWPELKTTLESWSEFAIADSLFTDMDYSWTIDHKYASNEEKGSWRLDNATVVNLKQVYYDIASEMEGIFTANAVFTTEKTLEDSVFNPQRFNHSSLDRHEYDMAIPSAKWYGMDPRFFNISEASLNELLFNITISTLTLELQRGMVPVTTEEYRNAYRFSEKLNFFLPYSVCLGTALFFILVAIRALINNGVPAADGGFLQIMMATRGRTEMERLVLKEGIVGTGDLSKELLNLKIRFGELVDTETTGKGAGTVGAGFAGPDNAMGEGAGFASVAVAESVASDISGTTATARSACSGTVSTESLTGDTATTSSGTTSLASLIAARDNTAVTAGVIRGFDTGMVGEGSRLVYRRVIGFGTVDETLPLRRKTQQTDITGP